jgi:hypothetical protein
MYLRAIPNSVSGRACKNERTGLKVLPLGRRSGLSGTRGTAIGDNGAQQRLCEEENGVMRFLNAEEATGTSILFGARMTAGCPSHRGFALAFQRTSICIEA